MKKGFYILFILLVSFAKVFGQTNSYTRADSIFMTNKTKSAIFIIQNATKDSTGAFAKNMGKGVLQYVKIKISDVKGLSDSLSKRIFFSQNFKYVDSVLDLADTISVKNIKLKNLTSRAIGDSLLVVHNNFVYKVAANYLPLTLQNNTTLTEGGFGLTFNQTGPIAALTLGATETTDGRATVDYLSSKGATTDIEVGVNPGGTSYKWGIRNKITGSLDLPFWIDTRDNGIRLPMLGDTAAAAKVVAVDANGKLLKVPTSQFENVANKATTFGTLNNTLYPTTQAVSNYVTTATSLYLPLTLSNSTTVDLNGQNMIYQGDDNSYFQVGTNQLIGNNWSGHFHQFGGQTQLFQTDNASFQDAGITIAPNSMQFSVDALTSTTPVSSYLNITSTPAGRFDVILQAADGVSSTLKSLEMSTVTANTGIPIVDTKDHMGLIADASIDTMKMGTNIQEYVTAKWVLGRINAYSGGGGSGTVTSITPGYGFTSSTPITTSGTLTIDTTSKIASTANHPTFAQLQTKVNDYLLTTTAASTYQPIGTYLTPSSTNVVTNKDLTSGTNTFPTFTAASGTLTGTTLNSTVVTSSLTSANLAALTATDASLTFSGSYNGNTARTVGVNFSQTPTWTALHSFNQAGNGTTPTDMISIGTTLAATSPIPNQYSGGLNFLGYTWNTTSSASHAINFRMEVEPVSGPTDFGYLTFKSSKNGGAYSAAFNISTDGNFIIPVGNFTINKGFIGNTSTDGLLLDGVANSSAGTPIQKSTRIRQQASIWNTTATAAANYTGFSSEVSGVSGTTPTGELDWYGGIGVSTTVSLTKRMSLDASTGGLTLYAGGKYNLSGSSSGVISIAPQAAAGTYNFNLPITAGTAGQVLTSQGGGSTAMTWISTPTVQASADLTAQTTAGNITTFTVGASTATFNISSYINVTAVSVDVIQGQITYTDENNTAQTISLSNLSAIGNSTYSPITIRAKNATVITVKTNLTTGAGSITFDAGARITQI